MKCEAVKVTVTLHAEERAKERFGWNKDTLLRMAKNAHERGSKYSALSGHLQRYIKGKLEYCNDGDSIVVHGDAAYIFAEDPSTAVLKSLICVDKGTVEKTPHEKIRYKKKRDLPTKRLRLHKDILDDEDE